MILNLFNLMEIDIFPKIGEKFTTVYWLAHY